MRIGGSPRVFIGLSDAFYVAPRAIFGSFGRAGRNYAAARLRILTRL